MRTCLIDLRCLQDRRYTHGDIGRHARAVMSHARESLPGTHTVGLIDPLLPSLSETDLAMVDDIRTTGYTGRLNQPTCFVQLSPMTHDPLFIGRLLTHSRIPCATVVHDLISTEDLAFNCEAASKRLEYQVALRWLARYDLFLPISSGVARDIAERLLVAPERVAVTGTPLGQRFKSRSDKEPRHLLVVGGTDENAYHHVIRAHARSAQMQAKKIPLVLTSEHSAEWIIRQREDIATLGGNPDLLEIPGPPDEISLHHLIAFAMCVIAPSRMEANPLTLSEAMAAGVPVLASDSPAHRGVVGSGCLAPDEGEALGELLFQLNDVSWRRSITERQSSIWPEFINDTGARRFWSAVDRLRPLSAPATVTSRAKVALLTPLPPRRSDLADNIAITCLELGKQVDLHVFTPTSNPNLPVGAVTIQGLSAFPMISDHFDRVVGILGNSRCHREVLTILRQFGGAVILYDDFSEDLFGLYLAEREGSGVAAEKVGEHFNLNLIQSALGGDGPVNAFNIGNILATAQPLMIWSTFALDLDFDHFGIRPIRLPFFVRRSFVEADFTPKDRARARERLNLSDNEILILSIDSLQGSRAPLDCLWSLVLLRSWGFEAKLHFIGPIMIDISEVDGILSQQDLSRNVTIVDGVLDELAYRDYLVGADVGLQLCVGPPGQASGALSDCIAAGLRTVASAALSSAIDAPDFVTRIPDHPSPVLIAEAIELSLLYHDTAKRRVSYTVEHTPKHYANDLYKAIDLS